MGHGTMCAGIAGAIGNNGIGVAGVCWDCTIMPLKIINETGWLEYRDISRAIEYAADNGADVLSMSLGTSKNLSYIRDAINYAYEKGVFLVAACGNSNTSDKMYPAAHENVLAVAGTDHNDSRMNFYVIGEWLTSSYGDWVDVCAPGQYIYVTYPTYHVFFNDLGFDLNYDIGGGTSASCPHVAGIASLMLSKDPSLSPEEIRSIIKTNVDPYDSEYYIGTGRINAYKALLALSNTPPETPSISGKTNGKPGIEYEYCLDYAVDPDGDSVYVWWDWGDETDTGWLGPYETGDPICEKHSWLEEGNYIIKAKLKDTYDAESDWASLEVSMPKGKTTDNPLLRFLESHPILYQLIQRFLKL